MTSFTQLINFIMELIDLIKKFFGGGNTPENDDQQQEEILPEG